MLAKRIEWPAQVAGRRSYGKYRLNYQGVMKTLIVESKKRLANICRATALALVAMLAATSSGTEPANPPALKSACQGLMTSGWGKLPSADLKFINSVAINVRWANLEPQAQQFNGPDWDKIEEARKHGYRIKLRILCGIYAPDFVKKLGGVALSDAEHHLDATSSGGVAIWNEFSKQGGTTACFWKKEVLDRYEQLMTEVARRYEDAPDICEVVDSACMIVFAEPFYRAHRHTPSNTRLWDAGLTYETDLAAHQRALQIHARLFHKTRTALAINAWDIVDDSPGHCRSSWAETRALVEWARKLFGERLTLQNNGFWIDSERALQQNPETSHLAYIRAAPGFRGFQARLNPQSEDQFFQLANLGVRFGVNFMEFTSYKNYNRERLRTVDAGLRANDGSKQ